MDGLSYRHLADIQLVNVHGHLQIAQVVDGAEGFSALYGVSGLVLLIHHRPLDGGGDGIVIQLVLGAVHGELRVPQAVPGAQDGILQRVAAQGHQRLTL